MSAVIRIPEPHELADAYYGALDARDEAIYARITCGECSLFCACPTDPSIGVCERLAEYNGMDESWTHPSDQANDDRCSVGDPEPINPDMLED